MPKKGGRQQKEGISFRPSVSGEEKELERRETEGNDDEMKRKRETECEKNKSLVVHSDCR